MQRDLPAIPGVFAGIAGDLLLLLVFDVAGRALVLVRSRFFSDFQSLFITSSKDDRDRFDSFMISEQSKYCIQCFLIQWH
ncbi:hypothetical protein CVT26_009873 [Gymnopilus dilepis]|uniref:Uncharacterized protein n=1 Tax=Gymnopilus dilepis TaxID=231916 RepID=A0A409YBV8_9AGAR|nr:hypothetical protein CVT26_009873 [Gymnopilus dilepis]